MMNNAQLRSHHMRLAGFALLLLLVMLGIFLMSARPGEDSARMSDGFADTFLGRFFTRILPQLTDDVNMSLRKYAHMFEFFCLGISSFLFFFELFWVKEFRTVKTTILAVLWSFLYACSDEWHQTFVPERAGRWSDLRFDAVGFLFGIALLAFIEWMRKKRKESAST